jgi:hypothetical protein
VLTRRGWSPEVLEVLEVELADKPGALAQLASALGQAEVQIGHVYVGTGSGRKASVFLGVSDLASAVKVAARALR